MMSNTTMIVALVGITLGLIWVSTLFCITARNIVFWWKHWGRFVDYTPDEVKDILPKEYTDGCDKQTADEDEKQNSIDIIKHIEQNARSDNAHYCYFCIPVVLTRHINGIIRKLARGNQPNANKTKRKTVIICLIWRI